MDMLKLLFTDVAQIPILSNATQELWLGIQIKSPQTWAELGLYGDDLLPTAICASLEVRFSRLLKAAHAYKVSISTPKLVVLADEALKSRKDIYGFQRSNLYQFVKSTATLPEATRQKITDEIYDIAELLCLLPEPILEYFAKTPEDDEIHLRLPEWIKHYQSNSIWQTAEQRVGQARLTLASGYLRYVLRIARYYTGHGLDYLDLVQEGALGLMRAAERFDYREGTRFAVYASNWIRQGISRAIADQGRTIRLPVHMHERVCSLQKQLETDTIENVLASCTTDGTTDLEEDETTSSTNQQFSTDTKVRHKIYRIIEYCQPLVPVDLKLPISLCEQAGITDEVDVTLADCIADCETKGVVEISYEQLKQTVQTAFNVAQIKGRDLGIVHLRYGFVDGQEHTLEEVGQYFNITRERVRQIEKRTLEKLRPILRQMGIVVDFTAQLPYSNLLPFPINSYLDEHFNMESDSKYTDMISRQQIDYYLAQLPGGDWHTYLVPGSSTRQAQVAAAMRVLEAPAHYHAITKQVNGLVDKSPIDANYVYGLLVKYEDIFVRLGEGFFSLVEWERQRAVEKEPVLSFCPAPLPDPPDQPNAFFESVIRVREILRKPCNVATLLHEITKWVGLPWPQPRWVCQSALSTYYLVGAIPYVFYDEGVEQLLTLTLPLADLSTLRPYCLDTLSRRLQAMPEFWWLLQRHQPIRVTELAQLFVAAHPFGLDDVANRLNLLTSIGATLKSSYGGRYQLTSLGETLAERWAQQPENIGITTEELPEEEEWDFVGFDSSKSQDNTVWIGKNEE